MQNKGCGKAAKVVNFVAKWLNLCLYTVVAKCAVHVCCSQYVCKECDVSIKMVSQHFQTQQIGLIFCFWPSLSCKKTTERTGALSFRWFCFLLYSVFAFIVKFKFNPSPSFISVQTKWKRPVFIKRKASYPSCFLQRVPLVSPLPSNQLTFVLTHSTSQWTRSIKILNHPWQVWYGLMQLCSLFSLWSFSLEDKNNP